MCAKAGDAAYHAARTEKEKAKAKAKATTAAWRAANLNKMKATTAAWCAANSERVKATRAEWYRLNAKKLKVSKIAYRLTNSSRIKERNAIWWRDNPELARVYSHNRRARKLSVGGKLSKGLFDKLFVLQRGKCPVCKTALSNVRPRSPMDHIVALVNGGANEDSNIQILCQPCNQQKHVKDPIEFMQSRGFLL